jgi:protease II
MKIPEVTQYLKAENAYTDSIMKPTEILQNKLYDEMLSHIKETDVNVPYKEGDHSCYSRWEAGNTLPNRVVSRPIIMPCCLRPIWQRDTVARPGVMIT